MTSLAMSMLQYTVGAPCHQADCTNLYNVLRPALPKIEKAINDMQFKSRGYAAMQPLAVLKHLLCWQHH